MYGIAHTTAVAFASLGLLFCSISTTTKFWYEIDTKTTQGEQRTYQGLWEGCTEITNSATGKTWKKCTILDIPDGENGDKFRVTRAFTILAIITYSGVVISLMVTFVKKIVVAIFFLLTFLTVFLQMVGMATFTDIYKDSTDNDGVKFGWSFILGWAGFVCAVVTFILGVALQFISKEKH